MKKFFNVSQKDVLIYFQTHAKIDLELPVAEQLHRRRLVHRSGLSDENIVEIKRIIEWNSSLKIFFGWHFDSQYNIFEEMMSDCEVQIRQPFPGFVIETISDTKSNWLGFAPFNSFDSIYYKDFCIEDLITFNNRLIDFQIDVVTYITNHPAYKSNAIVKDYEYRFKYFKKVRKDPEALAAAFQYYVDSVISSRMRPLSVSLIEEMIGHHFLHHPYVFFELINFNVLKGILYE